MRLPDELARHDRTARSLRVVHVGKYYPPAPGGIERVVQTLCEHERAVVDSRVVAANQGPATVHEVVNGVPVVRAGSLGKVGSVAIVPSFPVHLRRAVADVMVVHEPNPVALVAHALARPPARLVVWYHSEVVRPQWRYRAFYRPFLRRLLSRAERIIVASPPMTAAAELADFRDKCQVIPYGIRTDRFEPSQDVRDRAAAIRRRHRGPIVLFVGRMVSYKGVDVLLRAMDGVDATAILVGDGPLRPALEAQARALGITGHVSFAGQLDDADLLATLHACDVLVLPSVTRAEAFGMVQLEAMACGKPVVSTRLASGVPWVNRDGETGLVAEPGDIEGLRHAIVSLTSDPTYARRLGEHARKRVEREFTTDRMVQSTTALYAELVTGRGEPVPSEPVVDVG